MRTKSSPAAATASGPSPQKRHSAAAAAAAGPSPLKSPLPQQLAMMMAPPSGSGSGSGGGGGGGGVAEATTAGSVGGAGSPLHLSLLGIRLLAVKLSAICRCGRVTGMNAPVAGVWTAPSPSLSPLTPLVHHSHRTKCMALGCDELNRTIIQALTPPLLLLSQDQVHGSWL